MDILAVFLAEQRQSAFRDLAGAHATATVPVPDRLLNQLLTRLIPPNWAVRTVEIQARDGNLVAVDLRAAAGAMTLPLHFELEIESQPVVPSPAILGLRMKKAKRLFAMGGVLMRLLDVLPAGIAVDGDRIDVNLTTLLKSNGAGELLQYLTGLRVTTTEGVVLLEVRAAVASDPT